jgi:hypothetical protein
MVRLETMLPPRKLQDMPSLEPISSLDPTRLPGGG